jgi:GntR family transcriptional repressor for pyruvate dehydrogenase complex
MEDFKIIKRRRLYQDIVGQIQGFIKEGILKPGDRLPSERELAERLQVSRSSLREAIRALELQGLVVSRPGAGTFISTESLDSLISIIASSLTEERDALNDIFEVRHLLEPQIAALAAERATPEDIQRAIEALEEQERQVARGETGVEGDTAFHFAMAQATQNWALVKVVSTIADILRQSRDQSLQTPGRPQRSLASHRQILDVVRRNDREGAREAMQHHISQVEPAHFPVRDGLGPTSLSATKLLT